MTLSTPPSRSRRSAAAHHEEMAASLAFIQSLTASQQKTAIISATKADEDMKAGAFADNAAETYAGIPATALTPAQKQKLLAVAEVFAARATTDVAQARMTEIRAHLNDTHAAWIGGTDPFYLRIHSPVIWLKVDCQAAGPLGGAYGKELLRQHYQTSPHHQ